MTTAEIITHTTIVFITQVIFIGSRTWNVKSIADNDMPMVIISGVVINVSWVISTGISTISVHGCITDFSLQYVPIIISSIVGGIVGAIVGMKSRSKIKSKN